MVELKLNINDLVEFKLTKKGKEILRKHELGIHKIYDPDDEKMRMPLWQFAQIFGSGFSNGGEQLIIDNELIMDVS